MCILGSLLGLIQRHILTQSIYKYHSFVSPMLVSVIIPCYNAVEYVGDAIQSVLDQTYRDIQIIVIDDGSTDRSREVIASYADKIRCHRTPNRGAAARNIGLRMARGHYGKFLDADDTLFSDAIASQMAVAHRSDAQHIVFGDVVYDGPSDLIQTYSRSIRDLPDIINQCILTSAPLHTKEALLRVGGFDEYAAEIIVSRIKRLKVGV